MFVYCIPFTVLNFEIFPGLVRKGMLIMVRLGKPKRRFRLTIAHDIYLPKFIDQEMMQFLSRFCFW